VESWDEIYEAIRARFLHDLGPRLDQIVEAVDLVDGNRGEIANVQALRRHFHKLSGAAGSYGWPHVSERSLDAELACAAIIARGTEATDEEIARWREFLASVSADLAKALDATNDIATEQ